MCGVLAHAGGGAFDTKKALACLAHRGPDHEEQLVYKSVIFGHRRLSIIDTAERSNQPMVSQTGNTAVVFNGEIYNYRSLKEDLVRRGARFATESDTEVILAGYELDGTAFFEKMRGMWAFVIHDRTRNELILARDPFGIKPLVYSTQEGMLTAASELRCLKALSPLKPNTNAFSAFYNLGYFPAPATPYEHVWKMLPGEVRTWNLEQCTFTYTAQVSRFAGNTVSFASREEAVEALDSALTDSVIAHYVSDVPVSMLLSGGNDSSLIAALSVKTGKSPEAYHVAIPGSDDTAFAKGVAKHLGLSLHIEELTEQTLAHQYEKVFSVSDEPTGDISIIPTSLVYERIHGNAKVVLSGEGGDELFGGYLRHALLAGHDSVRAQHPFNTFANLLVSAHPRLVSVWNPIVQRLRTYCMQSGIANDLIGAYIKSVRLLDYPLQDTALRTLLADMAKQESRENIPPSLLFDLIAYLPNDLLLKTDSASMASSIEARVPLLDRFLAQTVQGAHAVAGTPVGDKMLLKDVLVRYLPSNLVFRKKQGFGVPVHTYAFKAFSADFEKACDFHLSQRETFGVDDAMASLIQRGAGREVLLRKFPRFAFALISNWRYFKL